MERTAGRTEILIVDDEQPWREQVGAAVKAVFPEWIVVEANTMEAALDIIRAKARSLLIVISDGNIDFSGAGERITSVAVEVHIPHVAYYSNLANMKKESLGPKGIACFLKTYPQEEEPEELKEWLLNVRASLEVCLKSPE